MSNEINSIKVTDNCIFTVRLDSQVGSTGYSWALAHMPDSVNLLDISFETSSSHIVGCKETQVYTFVALKKDEDYIEFNLIRPWEPEKVADQKKFTIIIEAEDETANELQTTAGCHTFASFGDTCIPNGISIAYMSPGIQQCNSNQVNALYMGLPVMKYMGPPVMKYMGPPVLKYMAPVDSKDDCDK
jgi:predicted secreted protein